MNQYTLLLEQKLSTAQTLQQQQRWKEALSVYKSIDVEDRDSADIKYRIGFCLFKLGDYAPALQYALQSSQMAPNKWQAKHLTALALRMNGRLPEALKLLSLLSRRFPDVDEIRKDYGDFVCKVLGNWSIASDIWKPLKDKGAFEEEFRWFDIKQKIYDSVEDDIFLTGEIKKFSQTFLNSSELLNEFGQASSSVDKRRLRVGLISTFFRATPVYYLCFSALKHMSEDFDLVFYARETVEDWATEEFKSIACDWQNVKHLNAEDLAKHLYEDDLDVIIDMCGWLDREALKALATRPAKRQYKWIGGQSTTTGMNCFDGYLTDEYQSPKALQAYYTEPLIMLDSGYASYTPPSYLPSPKPRTSYGQWQAGVIAHPMKVSQPFLHYLRQQIIELEDKADFKVNLQFIGWRYGQPALQKSILRIFQPVFKKASKWLSISFVTTKGHKEFLEKVSNLDWVIDTFPYTSGVTALETLALGVPCRTRAGVLFSQRHAYSHCRYAGLDAHDFDLDILGAFRPPVQNKSGMTLLPQACDRRNHEALAMNLAKVLNNG
jgi:hypothetical protein